MSQLETEEESYEILDHSYQSLKKKSLSKSSLSSINNQAVLFPITPPPPCLPPRPKLIPRKNQREITLAPQRRSTICAMEFKDRRKNGESNSTKGVAMSDGSVDGGSKQNRR